MPAKTIAPPSLRATILRLLLVAAAILISASAVRAEDFSEPPRSLGDSIAPTLLVVKGMPIIIRQEAQESGDRGQAWISLSRQVEGLWSTSRVAGPISYRGSEPVLYSAAVGPSGELGIVTANSATSFSVLVSFDGGASFASKGTLLASDSSVGPRLFPSASGGWLIFLTQARQGGGEGAAIGVANTNTIVVSASPDGVNWSRPIHLVADSEGLVNNYLPTAATLGASDWVVFQHQILGGDTMPSHWWLYSKHSEDGGKTWSAAIPVTDFQDPAPSSAANRPSSGNYDNQAPRLLSSNGLLHLAWQRRLTSTTTVRVAVAALDTGGRVDPANFSYVSSPSGPSILSDFTIDEGQPTVVYLDDRLAANEVWRRRLETGGWSPPEALSLTVLADPTRSGLTSFARASTIGGRLYALWEYDDNVGTRLAPVSRSRVFLLEPVLHVDPPRIAIPNYVPGTRSRDEKVLVGIAMPRSSAGIARLAWLWRRAGDQILAALPSPLHSKDEIWKTGQSMEGSPSSIILDANEDGTWILELSIEDRAGNRSRPVALSYFRDRTPPEAPIIIHPDLAPDGSLASNSLDLHWLPSTAPDIAGYSWTAIGPLDPGRIPASYTRNAKPLPGVSATEAALVAYYGLPKPPPAILTRTTDIGLSNIDNGWWMYSIAAIDGTGNVSATSTVVFRATRQIPFTLVTDIKETTDLIGRRTLAIDGRGFLDQGAVIRVLLARDRAAPPELSREAATGGFHIVSNFRIDGVDVGDVPAGSYWLGILHPKRGLYWAPGRVVIDVSGTLKYGIEYAWKPSWKLLPPPTTGVSVYDIIVAAAALFFGLGILLSMGQALSVVREARAVRLQVLAFVNGGPMPSAVREKAIRRGRRRGLGLQIKFTFFIATLVLFVVLLVAFSLGANMVRNQSQALARGLGDAANVLLESAAQGGRFFLDRDGAVSQLGFLPTQAKAMPGAKYITITGNSQDPKVAGRDIVYASNDPDIGKKISSSRLDLGVSPMNPQVEALAAKVPAMAEELESKAREAIAGDLAKKDELQKQKAGLPTGSAGDADRQRINASLDDLDRSIRDRLRTISDGAAGSIPPFNPADLGASAKSYLFFKPILEYRPGDQRLWRGMVRLEASTSLIVADVATRTRALVVSTSGVAALVLLVGIIGAFLLSRSIVRPIGRVIQAIEKMRDTEDKEELEGYNVEVGTNDELAILARAANALAVELVDGAKQSKALIEGADIQNHFIPLSVGEGGRKLTISRQDTPNYELFGYYKGAKRVSGDYWNFEPLGDDGRYYYFIKCDVSGKDVSAAFIMVQVGTMVINHFRDWPRLSKVPGFNLVDLTYRINDFLIDRRYRGKFAAFTIGVISMTDGIIDFCHAGDNMFRVWRAAQGRTVSEPFQPDIDRSSPASGLIDRELLELKGTGFYPYRRQLAKGDILLLYSDGMEDPIHRFRDAAGEVRRCTELPGAADEHPHHDKGAEAEHLGPERLDAYIEAYDRREVFVLNHDHESERDLRMSFDFTKADGSLEERVIAYLAVGKVFSIYDWKAGEEASILVDKRVDAFLRRCFDQYDLVFRQRENLEVKSGRQDEAGREIMMAEPNYVRFRGIREDEQYDDLSIAGIRRK
ncbi:MAG TPA: SpoIIE family protein phosphatase [Rectinemataceae bacterium]|nr:SpoIIE family protein phosphatase [Rectinemataceae bacterium]